MKKKGNLKINPPSDFFHLQWHITERCNLRCKHCYMDEELLKDEMDFDSIRNILYQYFGLLKEWGIPKVKSRLSFTGGEPFIRKDFFNILEECWKNHEISTYGILCNGFFLSDENVSRLKSLGVHTVQVSIEGMKRTNDDIRGKGSFVKAIEGLERVVAAGMGTSISMTVHQQNLKEIPAMIDLARSLKVRTLGLRRLVPFGHAKTMTVSMLSPLQTRDLMAYATRISSQIRDLVILIGCEDGIAAQDMHYFPRGCTAGFNSLTLLPNGNVYPCRRLPVFVGNLRKDTLKDVFWKSKLLDEFRNVNNINDECLCCQFFNECLGGAKCISYAYWGKLGGGDPQCWRRFDALPNPKLSWRISGKEKKTLTYF